MVKYDTAGDDGVTLRQHLVQGRKEAPETEIPYPCEYIFEWFWQLSIGRNQGVGVSGISSVEIKAWCDLQRVKLTSFELSAIMAMDIAFLDAQKKRSK